MEAKEGAGTAAVRFVVLGLVLGGCSPAVAQQTPFETIRGARVHGVIVTPQIRFKLETVTSTLVGFGMPGRAGEEVLQKYRIPEPAVRLRERFLERLGPGHAAEVLLAPGVVTDDGAGDLKKAFGEGFVLDFRTRIWRLMYSAGKKHHKIEYWGRVRLVRLSDSKVLWNETCKFLGDAKKVEGADEDMLANDAALLRSTFDLAVDHCVAELSAEFGVR